MARSYFDFHTKFKNSFKDTSTNNTTLKCLNFSSGFVNIETSNDDHSRRYIKMPFGHWDFTKCLQYAIDIVFHLC